MKVDGVEFTKQDEKDCQKMRSELMKVMRDNANGMKILVAMCSLMMFLSDVSKKTETYGVNRDKYIDLVKAGAKYLNKLKEQKRDK